MNLSPTTQKTLLELGLLNQDKSFSSRLSASEVYGFLSGQKLSATNGKSRLELQLDPRGSTLQIKQYSLDKDFSLLKERAQTGALQTLRVQEIGPSYLKAATENKSLYYPRKFFIEEPKSKELLEIDPLEHRALLKEILLRRKDEGLEKKYRAELFKLRKFLLESLKTHPEKAKEIGGYLSSVGKEIQKNENKKTTKQTVVEPSKKASVVGLSGRAEKEPSFLEKGSFASFEETLFENANTLLPKEKETRRSSTETLEKEIKEEEQRPRSFRR